MAYSGHLSLIRVKITSLKMCFVIQRISTEELLSRISMHLRRRQLIFIYCLENCMIAQ